MVEKFHTAYFVSILAVRILPVSVLDYYTGAKTIGPSFRILLSFCKELIVYSSGPYGSLIVNSTSGFKLIVLTRRWPLFVKAALFVNFPTSPYH